MYYAPHYSLFQAHKAKKKKKNCRNIKVLLFALANMMRLSVIGIMDT